MTKKPSLFDTSSESPGLDSPPPGNARLLLSTESDSDQPQRSKRRAPAPALDDDSSSPWEPAKNTKPPTFSDSSSVDDPIASAVNLQFKMKVPAIKESDSSDDAWPSIVEQPKQGKHHAVPPPLDDGSDSDHEENASAADAAFDAKFGKLVKRYAKGDIIDWDEPTEDVPVLNNKTIIAEMKQQTTVTQLLDKLRKSG